MNESLLHFNRFITNRVYLVKWVSTLLPTLDRTFNYTESCSKFYRI